MSIITHNLSNIIGLRRMAGECGIHLILLGVNAIGMIFHCAYYTILGGGEASGNAWGSSHNTFAAYAFPDFRIVGPRAASIVANRPFIFKEAE